MRDIKTFDVFKQLLFTVDKKEHLIQFEVDQLKQYSWSVFEHSASRKKPEWKLIRESFLQYKTKEEAYQAAYDFLHEYIGQKKIYSNYLMSFPEADKDEWETKYFVKFDVAYLQLLNFTISGPFEDMKKVKADLKRFVKTKYPDLSFSFNE